MADYTIPLTASQNSNFAININNVQYNLSFLFVDGTDASGAQNAGWLLDVYDQNMQPLILGIILVTGEDLLGQFAYLGLGFTMFCYTIGNPSAPPNFNNLGVQGQVVVEY